MTSTRNRRRIALGALAVLLAAGAGVALARRDTASPQAPRSSVAPAATDLRRNDPKASTGAATVAGGAAAGPAGVAEPANPVPVVGPPVVRTADLQVKVRGPFDAAVDQATGLAAQLGGFVTASSTAFVEGRENGDLTLRIPAARFDEARRRLGELGTLESSRISGQDVGGQLVDLDARLRTLRTEEGALDTLLGRATDIGPILQIRDRLTAVRTEIEQLAGQQAALQDQVALATIRVVLHEPGAAPAPRPEPDAWDLGRSLRTSWHATLAVVGGMLIVLGALLPLLVLVALALPFVVRHRRRAPVV